MNPVFKNSQYGFAISALQPNQALFVSVITRQAYFDEVPSSEMKILLTLEEREEYAISSTPVMLTEAYLPIKTVKIEFEVFMYQTLLELVEGTENVTDIRYDAFSGCEKLKSIKLNSVRRLGNTAFSGCVALKTVNLPNVETVGDGAFMDCINAEVTLNDDVQSVGNNAFKNVKHLYYHGNLAGAPWGADAWN